jgi:hypothetical protein
LGEQDAGFEQVRRCARDFPGFEPERSPYLPESIRSFFDRAAQKLRGIQPATISIETVRGRGSDRCRALVNGIDKGGIPATVANLRTNKVRVQVECGDGLGRIYDVALSPGKNSIIVDPTLDRAVQTQASLKLVYPDEVRARDLTLDHALQVAKAIGAERVVLLWGGTLVRVDSDTRRIVARASLNSGTLDEVISAVIEGRGASADPAPVSASNPTQPTRLEAQPASNSASEQPTAAAEEFAQGSTARERDGSSGPPFGTLAWVAVGGAVAGGGTGLVAWRIREGEVSSFNKGCLGALDATGRAKCQAHLKNHETAESVQIAALIVGGGFAAAAAVLFILDSNGEAPPEFARSCSPGPGDIGLACKLRF